ncbi:chemotaxis-specific protein-glutamate methyltransferase CheB [Cyanobacterium sp. Dongsha4]|uniref:chemotaxis-specific protein-glutamate methyltransferase CheB n=1 Tax=Cyanobacterium sp. DS4 TaxID=2878255 RepID=UPI000F25A98A|nr:chemotaxis-specific protein-glutamate methyltransferase CheB [Cyanobacterium sp. Dongsha4]RMD68108.1 MAG: chemotaxis-specific protein-glutamate methyltransferase CheB [Cyanobacteria bacterium J149]WVL00332.1 chemotaxis-specific protein-glutamate methyltransferase CheB [Cyanobacterium sp. Dongsha4]
MIKVLLVEDSPVAVTILKRIIDSADDLSLVGTARTGVDALELIPKVKPDIICTDLMMPKMNGLELTQKVMETTPKPILVISACVQDEDKNNVFELLNAGAVDVFPKPKGGTLEDYESIRDKLISKIRILAGVKVFTKRSNNNARSSLRLTDPNFKPINLNPSPHQNETNATSPRTIQAVAIAASTGGPQAFQQVLMGIPGNFPVPIFCVQHISSGFLQGFLDWLQNYSQLKIVIAKTGERPQVGNIYFPPDRLHLKIDKQGRFYCGDDIPVDSHCPSATVLFQTIADYYKSSAIGVLMTGMGRDGARGLFDLKQRGAYTIAQDEATSVVFGMPQEAIKMGGAKTILPVTEITPRLLKLVMG